MAKFLDAPDKMYPTARESNKKPNSRLCAARGGVGKHSFPPGSGGSQARPLSGMEGSTRSRHRLETLHQNGRNLVVVSKITFYSTGLKVRRSDRAAWFRLHTFKFFLLVVASHLAKHRRAHGLVSAVCRSGKITFKGCSFRFKLLIRPLRVFNCSVSDASRWRGYGRVGIRTATGYQQDASNYDERIFHFWVGFL